MTDEHAITRRYIFNHAAESFQFRHAALRSEAGPAFLGTVYAYSPYGEAQTLGPDEGNPIQYTGRENDGTGLYYYRARYYDPVMKRFISEDPIGVAGGVNLSAYVGGDPISRTDPRGLDYPLMYPQMNKMLNPPQQQCICPPPIQLTPGQAIGGGMAAGAGIGAAAGLGIGLGLTAAEAGSAVGLIGTAGALARSSPFPWVVEG